MRSTSFACGLLWAALACAGAHAASFSCARAQTPVEKLICADPALSKLDGEMASAYRDRLATAVDVEPLVAEQRAWLDRVRDRCTTAACLQGAYAARARVLTGDVASFDCAAAATPVEKLICGDERLRYADRELAGVFTAVRDLARDPAADLAAQKSWLQQVRNACADVACLQGALAARADELRKLEAERFDALRARIGYRKPVFYSDVMRWPNDPGRTIVALATQASATSAQDASPQQDEDFLLDLYVIDSRSWRVLQHGTDGLENDAIALNGLSLDRTDYRARLGVAAFGLTSSYGHNGCAGYGGTMLALYQTDGSDVRAIVPGFTVQSTHGMCGSECENGSTVRMLAAAGDRTGPHPDLLVRERRVEMSDGPKGGACKSERTRRDYRLPFKAGAYVIPGEMAY